MGNKVSIYSCQDMQTARVNCDFTEVYNTVEERKIKWWDISESNLIFNFFLYLQKYQSLTDFLTPLNALNFFYLKEKFYKQTNQRSGFVLWRDSSTSQPASSYPERAQNSHSSRLAQPQPTLVTPRKFSLTAHWLSTHSGTHLQIFRSFNLLLTLIFQGNKKSSFMIKPFCSKFSLLMYPCGRVHSNTANFSHRHGQKILNKRQLISRK